MDHFIDDGAWEGFRRQRSGNVCPGCVKQTNKQTKQAKLGGKSKAYMLQEAQ